MCCASSGWRMKHECRQHFTCRVSGILLVSSSEHNNLYMPESATKAQHYDNHVRYYPPHHFVFLPLIAALTIGSAYCIIRFPEHRLEWIAITAAFAMIAFLVVMLRQHYALGNQNRVVRLELRLRYYQITGQRFEPEEAQLSFSQLAALRFAPDDELPALVQQALAERLSADDIKKRIKNWLPDYMRL
jgi:hypothetical protein